MDTPITPQERFEYAFKALIESEGGFSNQILDHGGETNYGITERELQRICMALSLPPKVKDLTLDDAAKYYKTEWWDKYHYETINSSQIASKIFNMAVNMGEEQAIRIVQRAVNWIGFDLEEDGIMGAKTFATLNEIAYHKEEFEFIHSVIEEQRQFYESLVEKNPDLQVFLKGWLNRAQYNPS